MSSPAAPINFLSGLLFGQFPSPYFLSLRAFFFQLVHLLADMKCCFAAISCHLQPVASFRFVLLHMMKYTCEFLSFYRLCSTLTSFSSSCLQSLFYLMGEICQSISFQISSPSSSFELFYRHFIPHSLCPLIVVQIANPSSFEILFTTLSLHFQISFFSVCAHPTWRS